MNFWNDNQDGKDQDNDDYINDELDGRAFGPVAGGWVRGAAVHAATIDAVWARVVTISGKGGEKDGSGNRDKRSGGGESE